MKTHPIVHYSRESAVVNIIDEMCPVEMWMLRIYLHITKIHNHCKTSMASLLFFKVLRSILVPFNENRIEVMEGEHKHEFLIAFVIMFFFCGI